MKQRSKEELLNLIRTHQALQKDLSKSNKSQTAGNAVFWRVCVEWVYVLWHQGRMNVNSLQKILAYTVNNYGVLTDERREEIREKMDGCQWILKNTAVKKKCRNAIDQSWNNLEYFNTEVSVDLSLLVCEWMIDNRKCRPEILDRYCSMMLYLYSFPFQKVYEMRKLIYKHKGIWISLNDEDTENNIDMDEDIERKEDGTRKEKKQTKNHSHEKLILNSTQKNKKIFNT